MDIAAFFNVTLGGFIGSGVATTILGWLLLRRTKTIESEIKSHFDERLKVFESTRAWKQQSLSELLGPVIMQFERTKAAFDRWNGKNLFLEAQVVRTGNQTIRDTLLATSGAFRRIFMTCSGCERTRRHGRVTQYAGV